jgi:hypothetical protein
LPLQWCALALVASAASATMSTTRKRIMSE